MAEKKENKAIGYVVLSFIPLIGIIWAGIVGIQHELIVKDAKKAEEAFEAKLVQKINETQIAKDNNIVLGEVDLTSIVLNKYSIKLQNDDVSTNKFSYTVRLGTDPKTSYDENDNTVVDSFGFVYEFFVDADTYTTITESFENDKIGVLGYEEYVFETYCPDKPTSTPIYVIESIFDKYYAHTSYFEYNSEVYLGASPDTVIELINALPSEITLTKESLDAYKSKLDSVNVEYSILSDSDKERVENYNTYLSCVDLYTAKLVELAIAELPDEFSEISLLVAGRRADEALKSYEALTETQKALVTNYDRLTQKVFDYAVYKPVSYLEKGNIDNAVKFYNEIAADENKLTGFYNEFKKFIETGSTKTAVDFYNKLKSEQKTALQTNGKEAYDLLVVKVAEYNAKPENAGAKLELK